MKHFRKIWNEETNSFLISHKDMNKNYKAFYSAFMAKFPGCEVSYTAFKNQLSRLDLCKTTRSNFSTKQVPLYSEHQKKGYTFIKIAEPNEWISKSKWVYIATHPAEAFEHYSTKQKYLYVYLDGNNRNFALLCRPISCRITDEISFRQISNLQHRSFNRNHILHLI